MLLFNKKHRLLKIILAIILVVVIGLGSFIFRPDSYLPHKRIVLHAPYDLNDPPVSLIPMGEKIYHPNAPLGHPGIDIQWSGPEANVLAAADGKIVTLKLVNDKWDKWQMDIQNGPYVMRYKEMETYNTALKKGDQVRTGDILGHPADPAKHNQVGAFQIHWEFASVSVVRDRFCPMTYFDKASSDSMQSIWDKANWQYKSQYPDICSGGYANKTD